MCMFMCMYMSPTRKLYSATATVTTASTVTITFTDTTIPATTTTITATANSAGIMTTTRKDEYEITYGIPLFRVLRRQGIICFFLIFFKYFS